MQKRRCKATAMKYLLSASVRPHVLGESFDRSLQLIQAATSEFKGPGQVTVFDSLENLPIGLKS